MTDSAVPPVANRVGRLSVIAEWQMLHGLAARDGERRDHVKLLAWRRRCLLLDLCNLLLATANGETTASCWPGGRACTGWLW